MIDSTYILPYFAAHQKNKQEEQGGHLGILR